MKVYNISSYVKVRTSNYETPFLGIRTRMSMESNHKAWYIFPFLKKFACIPILGDDIARHNKWVCKYDQQIKKARPISIFATQLFFLISVH